MYHRFMVAVIIPFAELRYMIKQEDLSEFIGFNQFNILERGYRLADRSFYRIEIAEIRIEGFKKNPPPWCDTVDGCYSRSNRFLHSKIS